MKTAYLWLILFASAVGCNMTKSSSDVATQSLSGTWGSDRIIDIHGHIGTFAGYDLSVQTLSTNIDTFGIRMVLVSNVDGANLPGVTLNLDVKTANTATLELVQKHPDRFRGLVWARPNDGHWSQVEPFLADSSLGGTNPRPFVGMKLHPVMNQFPADAAVVDDYFRLCETYGVPVVFHSDKPGTNGDPVRIYAAARRHPTVPVILYHMVFFGPHAPAIDVVAQSLQLQDANLYLETSQARPEDVVAAVKALGAKRILFGTDATYFGAVHYQRYVDMVDLLRKELTPDEFDDIMRNNAQRLFRIDD